ncbi:peptidase S41 [Streptomyces sp. WAC 06738]|uniref:S41 family peptidase n=1 Tax=Streptomyces sp. WAC 06738 TaxID=2203210 RepID=UPI000F714A00|nr:S41 family peptidase [Streptomyces sp. WAC 06738]AZM50704.1 peptidase S41 [Streptomyces sp. WAC 06738]
MVFVSVLATGAATGSWPGEAERPPKVLTGHVADEQDYEPRAGEGDTAGSAGELVSRSGDRWSTAYSAREYESLQQMLAGKYVGVGLWIKTDGAGRMEIAQVGEESPAAEAGIRAGDTLRAVDGTPVAGRPVTEVVALLRGEELGEGARGSTVVLALQRGERRWTRPVRRVELTTEPVTVRQDRPGGEGAATPVIRVESFTRGSGAEVRRAAAEARGSDGLILDLRGNSGGLVVEAVEAASGFLDDGVVATYDLEGSQQVLYAKPGGNTRTPMVVLVDGGTMSSAELLAGALQDRGRAVVVGSRTFGKGSVQMPKALPDGSVAELTVGEYRTPAGRSLEGVGVTPDLDLAVAGGRSAEEEARTVLSGLGSGV